MASIDIFPLAINGVQPPLNLLTNVLTPSSSTPNLFYPIDLASNPTYCHAIQFTVFDYETPGLTDAMRRVSNLYATQANQQTKNGLVNQAKAVGEFFQSNLGTFKVPLGGFKTKIIFSAIKGIIPQHNLIVGEYLHQIDRKSVV